MSNKPKLKPEHLVPFVLHDLNMWTGSMVCKLVLYKAQPEYKHGVMIYEAINNGVLPILQPLSSLNQKKQIAEHYMTYKEHLLRLFPGETVGINIATWSHRAVEWLRQWHFDVFGLIEQGLAIDINTINLEDGTRKN